MRNEDARNYTVYIYYQQHSVTNIPRIRIVPPWILRRKKLCIYVRKLRFFSRPTLHAVQTTMQIESSWHSKLCGAIMLESTLCARSIRVARKYFAKSFYFFVVLLCTRIFWVPHYHTIIRYSISFIHVLCRSICPQFTIII